MVKEVTLGESDAHFLAQAGRASWNLQGHHSHPWVGLVDFQDVENVLELGDVEREQVPPAGMGYGETGWDHGFWVKD